MKQEERYSPEFRERAVGLVEEQQKDGSSQWVAMQSISAKLGCTAETLCRWVRQQERDRGERAGLTTDERAKLKQLEKENRELKRANEILRTASAYIYPGGARPPTGMMVAYIDDYADRHGSSEPVSNFVFVSHTMHSVLGERYGEDETRRWDCARVAG